ncbi:hypothetical protein Glove_443g47 [Diversispora epigaea]|uniref:Uncharacterized protein n=1 Tax=Diversispora epigaea TaxID=1348612 RepID=A0A397GW60_9GLOM|nr:hypothetical protein Glove_443g47 [Diversispora epigaea]
MSTTTSTINICENLFACNDIPYDKYFELCSFENYINKNLSILQDIQNIVQNLIENRRSGAHTYWMRLVGIMQVLKWMRLLDVSANKERKSLPSPSIAPSLLPSSSSLLSLSLPSSPLLSSFVLGKRQSDANITDFSSKKSYIIPNISYFCPEDIPLQVNNSAINILELAEVHSFEITGQWHLEKVCENGGYHHFYCDFTIKKSDDPSPVAVFELLATSSLLKLDEYFKRVFDYSNQFKPSEVWIIHFSQEDDVVKDPYWPCIRLQKRRLNVIHFWHNKNFTNVWMSARLLDTSSRFCEIIDQ